MTKHFIKQIGAGLVLGACLGATPAVWAQGRGGGGGGGGGFGGGGGGFGGGGLGGGGGARSGASGSSTRDYGNSTMIPDATFSIDPETHQILIATDDANFLTISNLLVRLDRPKPQVLINAVFLEVTHDDALDVGVEGSFFKSLGNGMNLGATNLFNLNSLGSTGQQIGSTTMPAGAGLYAIAGKDFAANIRAIASKEKTEVLSRPSVLVRNNQPATITVGKSIPLITGVTFNALNGQPINTIAYQNIGIILQVTPFITAKGLVEMIVAPQISSLSSQNINITTGVTAPAIDIRSASTVVVTPDGETVVIGGLMENSKTTVKSKIPILGDIPLLGAAFSHNQKANSKTELIIFITPHVVLQQQEMARLSEIEAHKAENATKAFSEKELNIFFPPNTLGKPEAAPAPAKSPTDKNK